MPAVLDMCCGSRMMWFDQNDQRALFGDQRSTTITIKDTSKRRLIPERHIEIHPDAQFDFRALPFADESFACVAFDPPHLVQAGAKSWLAAKYGVLGRDWREDLASGFREAFRVLKPEGILIFKWAEVQIPVNDILALTPEKPLFGHKSGKRSGTHWVTFMKKAKEAE